MDNMAIWSRFSKTGRVEDYLVYKRSAENKALSGYDGETYDDDEYGRFDTQGTEYR